jgi:hypothetical protein
VSAAVNRARRIARADPQELTQAIRVLARGAIAFAVEQAEGHESPAEFETLAHDMFWDACPLAQLVADSIIEQLRQAQPPPRGPGRPRSTE